MRKSKFLFIFFVCISAVLLLAGCGKDSREEMKNSEKIKLNKTSDVMLVGETSVLQAELLAADDSIKLIWESTSDDIVKVSKDGVLQAQKSGEAEILVQTDDGKLSKKCKIMVGDALVCTGFDDKTDGYGSVRFSEVQKAIDAAPDEGRIYVADGKYDEDLTVDKSITIIGLGAPQIRTLKAADNVKVELEKINFYLQEFPPADEAALSFGEGCSVKVKFCDFTVDIKEQPPESQKGGYAVYVAPKAKEITLIENHFRNFDYAMYLDKNGASINVSDNVFSECKYGIGLDIRNPDSKVPENFQPSGRIEGNVFVEVRYNSRFYYIGSGYTGDFTFKDHVDSTEQPDQQSQQKK